MRRKATTHRPLKALRHHAALKPRAPESAKAPLPTTGAVRLPERPRRVPPPRDSAIVVKPAPASPAFVLAANAARIGGARRELSAQQRRTLSGTPTATCDLHGHGAVAARRTLQAFVLAEHARGRSLVLVIVGKGRHSAGNRPVLRNEIADWLTAPPLAALVLAFCTAPPEFGGEGALLVRLSHEQA